MLLAAALLALAAGGSCSSAGDAEVRRTAERFLEALRAGDRAETALLAPGMVGDDRLDQLFAAMAGWSHWSIRRVSRDGDSARVVVAVTGGGRAAEVVLPVSRRGGAWIVDSLVVETRHLDVVPADR